MNFLSILMFILAENVKSTEIPASRFDTQSLIEAFEELCKVSNLKIEPVIQRI